MTSFISQVIESVLKSEVPLAQCVFVLPGKRAGYFLKKELLAHQKTPTLAPQIISIQEFVEEIADLKIAEPTPLVFELYKAYLDTPQMTPKESFEAFSSWATTLINDFSEIDRNLIPPTEFFSYLKDIKKLEQWHVQTEKTPLIENYIKFWNAIADLYQTYSENLLQHKLAYSGLAYREAVNNLEHFEPVAVTKKHFFVGFNALSKAEDALIQQLLDWGVAEVFWDTDRFFMDDPKSAVSYHHRQIQTKWKYYQHNPFNFVNSHFENPKDIQVFGCSKNIGQVKQATQLLADLPPEELSKTAVILADETLLLPVIHSLPQNVQQVNITMGLPINSMPLTSFFESWIEFHCSPDSRYYYKDLLKILQHPLGKLLLNQNAETIVSQMIEANVSFVSLPFLLEKTAPEEREITALLFEKNTTSPQDIIARCKKIILLAREKYRAKKSLIQLETLYKINEVFNSITSQNQQYGYIVEKATLHRVFQEVTAQTKLDFVGEPHTGLQIMGLLETRMLDFKNILLLSANEDILPSGKNNKSFITYDLKKQYGLPLYFEGDAVFAYHFFRLLLRAQKAYILYNDNNENSGLITGEKSRFVLQLQYYNLPAHRIRETTVRPQFQLSRPGLQTLEKTPKIMADIKQMAHDKGFSPSRLALYIRNPIEFYEKQLLKLDNLEEIEETVAANTMGTIIHAALETLYTPLIGEELTEDNLKQPLKYVDETVSQKFQEIFKSGDTDSGKNRIILEVARYFVKAQLKQDLELAKQNQIVIETLEKRLEKQILVSGLDFPVKLHGFADRIDWFNGQKRIIDYKTGLTEPKELKLQDMDLLITDPAFAKAFQVLCYAYMYQQSEATTPIFTGIISFRRMSQGFMALNNEAVSPELLQEFEGKLIQLIQEICNPEIPFVEKEV